MAYDRLLTKTRYTPRYELYLLLLSGTKLGDTFLFLPTLRGALCFLGLEGEFLIKLKAWKKK